MICRIWHGWTTPENARAYEDLLRTTVFPGILERRIPGFRSIELMSRKLPGEVEFITIMRFDSPDSVMAFAGPDREKSVVPPAAQRLLVRYDEHSQHYELRELLDTT